MPPTWQARLDALPFYRSLNQPDRRRLGDIARILVVEKNWQGRGGLTVDDEMRLTIAAQAALLILNLDHDYYRGTKTILIYPGAFATTGHVLRGGVVTEGESATLGLASHLGPVVLAWDAARHGAVNPRDGRNVVLHEFAHRLDMKDHLADGTPPLDRRDQYDAWVAIMTRQYDALIDDADRGRRTLLDTYGATNPAEFFAVATECFFEQPKLLQRKHAELYDLLRSYYRQDPAAWSATPIPQSQFRNPRS